MSTCAHIQLTSEQIRIVLSKMSINITQQQMAELLSRLGLNSDMLIDYLSFIEHFSSRSGSSLVHSILTDPNQKLAPYHNIIGSIVTV